MAQSVTRFRAGQPVSGQLISGRHTVGEPSSVKHSFLLRLHGQSQTVDIRLLALQVLFENDAPDVEHVVLV
jgi:hypothetical protein